MTTNRPAVLLQATAGAEPPFTWEETPCPLCGQHAAAPVLEAADPLPASGGLVFAVVRCAHCGLTYTNPRPDARSISRFYPADYHPHRRGCKVRQARG